MSIDHLDIVRRAEDEILAEEEAVLVDLLDASFPDVFDGRIYFKQRSTFRYLAYLSGKIIGHVGVIDRVIRHGDHPARIFGIVDLCVEQEVRSNGIGGRLVTTVVEAADRTGASFVLLFADDPRLYKRQGFRSASNMCTWVAIDEHRTLGVRNENLADCLMVREVGSDEWLNDQPIDLLGHVF